MDNKIEIYDNTLLKLLVRRGSNADRQTIVLSQGELGYTTDTNRLFVGDGVNIGGIVTGNKFVGSQPDVTSITNVTQGDYAFDSDSNKLNIFTGGQDGTGSPSNIANWTSVGGVYEGSEDGSIVVNPITNQISVGVLSAGDIGPGALGDSLDIDGTGRLILNDNIKTNSITTKFGTSHLKLQGNLNINNVNYNWPAFTSSNLFLQSDVAGNLMWSEATAPVSIFVSGAASQIPVGSIMPFVSAANAPFGWLLCNGQSVSGTSYRELSAVIGTSYGGTSSAFNVPDFTNKTLYGVQNNPAGSTTYSIATSAGSILSACGALYIIKAKQDNLVTSNITIVNGLTSTANGIVSTGVAISPLSSNISIGLPQLIDSLQEVEGGTSFSVDIYGRINSIATPALTSRPAGKISNINPHSTPIYNAFSPISFFERPVIIFEGNPPGGGLRFNLSAYPVITDSTASIATGGSKSVSRAARSLIFDCNITKLGPDTSSLVTTSSGVENRYIVAAPNFSDLRALGTNFVGDKEFLIAACRAAGGADNIRSASQAFIPLSANSAGHLVCGIRFSPSELNTDHVTLRIVGYTL